jgi:hypothetical protein
MVSRSSFSARPGLVPLLVLALFSGCAEEANEQGGFGPGGGASLVASGALPFSASQGTVLEGAGACASSGLEASYAKLVASQLSGLCGTWQAGVAPAHNRTIELVMIDPEADGGAVGVGSYAVSLEPSASGRHALLAVRQTDGACVVSAIHATAGSVELTLVSGERLAGTVVAQLAGGGEVSGAFDAAACTVDVAADLCSGEVEPVTTGCVTP